MIISFGPSATSEQIEKVQAVLAEASLPFQSVVCARTTLLVVTADCAHISTHTFNVLPGVQKVFQVGSRTPLALEGGRTVIDVEANGGKFVVGGFQPPVLIAGPCSVESLEQVKAVALQSRDNGAVGLRGGAFKPRTSPYDFQGLGLEGLKYLKEAGQAARLPVISEVMTAEQIEQAAPYVDVFQVGARNMYNYELLKELGHQSRPVVLKRGLSATVDELLHAAEYILLGGNLQVILCERGIRTFETSSRNTLDLTAVAVLKSSSNLPVLVDPSHASGKRHLVRPLARAAIACGADGLMIETHINPDKSYSDASQAITPEHLGEISKDITAIAAALQSRDLGDFTPEILQRERGREAEHILAGFSQSRDRV